MNTPYINQEIKPEQYISSNPYALNVSREAHIEDVLINGKSARALGVIIIVLFVGILLSFLVNFGVSAYLGSEELVDDYFDGEDHSNNILSDFADTFYLSKKIRNNIIKVDYYLFERLPTSDVLLGDSEFLFPTSDEKNSYSYVADYLGELEPKGSELDLYLDGINMLTKEYRKYGAGVYFVIIPNSQTVYPEKLPDYMGEISEYTRLKSTTRYLKKRGVTNYLDLTDALIAAKGEGELYNNTEDSLNSRGAYYAYLAILEMLPQSVLEEITPLGLKSDDLVHHTSTGKELAKLASLESEIKNRTVSLSTDFIQKYEILLRFEEYDMAYPKMQYQNDLPADPRIQFQFSDEWDRIIMTDFFSNTFGRTIYRTSTDFNAAVLTKADPEYVICFIHEKELAKLGDGSMMPNN